MNKRQLREKMIARYKGLSFNVGNSSKLSKHNCFLINHKGHNAFVEVDNDGKIIHRYPYNTHRFTELTGKHVRTSGYIDKLKKDKSELDKKNKENRRRIYISDNSYLDDADIKRATTSSLAGASTWINDNKEYINDMYSSILSKHGKMQFLCLRKSKLPKQVDVIKSIGDIFINQYNFTKYRYVNGHLYLHM